MTELSDKLERAPGRNAGPTIFEQLREMEGQFAAALPGRIDPEHFLRVAFTELRVKPALLAATPASLKGALMLSAQLGLVPGPLGHVYLVPYRNKGTGTTEIQFQIGYKGLILLAARAGYSITGDAIREGDRIEYEGGTNAHLIHQPKIRGAGDVYAWWVVIQRQGERDRVKVMNREEVERYRARSQSSKSGPWATDFDAMALKTVVKRALQLLPLDDPSVAADLATDGARANYQSGTRELTVKASDDIDPDAEPEPEEGGEGAEP